MKTALGSSSARQTFPKRASLNAMPCTGDGRSRSLYCWISEPRLTDAVLDMADKLIGRMFARAKNAQEKRYVASTKDVGRLMRLFGATIAALGVAQES